MPDNRHKFLFKPWGNLEIYKLDSTHYNTILYVGGRTSNRVSGSGCTAMRSRANLFDNLLEHMWDVCLKVEDEHR